MKNKIEPFEKISKSTLLWGMILTLWGIALPLIISSGRLVSSMEAILVATLVGFTVSFAVYLFAPPRACIYIVVIVSFIATFVLSTPLRPYYYTFLPYYFALGGGGVVGGYIRNRLSKKKNTSSAT
ncbi:hypothetical protein [Kocuria massiliensis]|uniref:hypothetical protein n=1 Tax=Kocuria massiliensis TaxID=1926282 RepID=UPI00117BB30D|nr:hypothetical protein [Kocuria massiliensis]